jgi:hypothetical protein
VNVDIDSYALAFGDLALIEDRGKFLACAKDIESDHPERPWYWKRWKTRERFRALGGRLIEELTPQAQLKYRNRVI